MSQVAISYLPQLTADVSVECAVIHEVIYVLNFPTVGAFVRVTLVSQALHSI